MPETVFDARATTVGKSVPCPNRVYILVRGKKTNKVKTDGQWYDKTGQEMSSVGRCYFTDRGTESGWKGMRKQAT